MTREDLAENFDEFLDRNRSRRDFILKTMLGTAGAACGSLKTPPMPYAAPVDPGKSTVSFVAGTDRRENIYQALLPLKDEVVRGIRGKQIVIKPNLVGPDLLSATPVDAIRGLLDFLKPLYKKTIIVGDSTGRIYPGPMGTWKHFELHGYLSLPKEYNVKLVDLNDLPTKAQWILDDYGHPSPVNIIETFLNPDNYVISLTRFKTHGRGVTATLGVKNIIMGSPVSHYRQKSASGRNEKALMHSGGHENLNFNMFLIAQKVHVDLSILDGFVGMEGNGPTLGTPVEHGVALAGTDWVAVDRLGTYLMDIDFGDILYLSYCAQGGLGKSDLAGIDVIGPNPADYIVTYRMNDNIRNQ